MAPSAIGLNGGGNKKNELLNLSGEPTEKVLDLIYDAAAENDLWRNVLTAIADLTNSQGGILVGQPLTAKQVYFEFNGPPDEACTRPYEERPLDNPWS